MLQQLSGGGFDMMMPDMTSTFHQQSLISCFLPTQSCSLPHSPSPVSPLTPVLPCIYTPNDSVVINIGDVGCKSQPASSVPVSSSSHVYCDSPIGYGSPYPFLKYTLYPIIPKPLLDPCEVENHSNSESLDSATGESTGVEECVYEYPVLMECSIPDYIPPCSVVSQEEEEKIETSEESQCSPISTKLLPECTEVRPQTPVPAMMAVEEVELKLNKESKLGGFGADGCWYPFAKDRTSDSVTADSFLQTDKYLKEHSSEWHQLHVNDIKSLPFISPLSLHMTPPPYGVRSPHKQKTLPLDLKPHPRHLPSPPFYNSFHQLNLPMNILGRPRLLYTFHKEGQLCVEEVWKMHMVLLFKNFPDLWMLNVADTSIKLGHNWSSFKDLAKVRFFCRNCHDGWTSMYGVVVFYYKLDCTHVRGQILYEVPGQKCRRCMPELFEVPMWYPEEAQKVITNLYYKIATHCYNLTTPRFIRSRRQGQPLTQHNRYLCQGCCHGLCKNDNDKKDE